MCRGLCPVGRGDGDGFLLEVCSGLRAAAPCSVAVIGIFFGSKHCGGIVACAGQRLADFTLCLGFGCHTEKIGCAEREDYGKRL